jgi:hypothetical protein
MQQQYVDLLKEFGVVVDPLDIVKEAPLSPPKSPVLPTAPHHYDHHGVAVFTAEQLSWAQPSDFGFDEDYLVVEEEHTSHPLRTNYSDEIYLTRKRPVHRYSRRERFKFTLGQLMGCSGNVPVAVLKAMDKKYLASLKSEHLWDAVRETLKRHNWRIYYNRVPAILAGLGMSQFRYSSTKVFQDIMHDFDLMDKIFMSMKKQLKRSYFPNLRYTAVRLMKRHGVVMPVNIPLARTTRKLQSLDQLYNDIWTAIEQKQFDDFFSGLLEH